MRESSPNPPSVRHLFSKVDDPGLVGLRGPFYGEKRAGLGLDDGIKRASSVDGLRASSSYYVGTHGGVSPYAATLGRSINRNFGLRRRTASPQGAGNKIFTYVYVPSCKPSPT